MICAGCGEEVDPVSLHKCKPAMICGNCVDSKTSCCIYPKLVDCFGSFRANNFRCVMANEVKS